jgi:hypothetical protein
MPWRFEPIQRAAVLRLVHREVKEMRPHKLNRICVILVRARCEVLNLFNVHYLNCIVQMLGTSVELAGVEFPLTHTATEPEPEPEEVSVEAESKQPVHVPKKMQYAANTALSAQEQTELVPELSDTLAATYAREQPVRLEFTVSGTLLLGEKLLAQRGYAG